MCDRRELAAAHPQFDVVGQAQVDAAGDVFAGGEEVAFVVIACRIGGDEVIDAVIGVAGPGHEVVDFSGPGDGGEMDALTGNPAAPGDGFGSTSAM